MSWITRILAAGVALAISTPLLACPSFGKSGPSAKFFDLVVDGTGDFSADGLVRIKVLRTIRGPVVGQFTVRDAVNPGEIWCPPGAPWDLFSDGTIPTDKPVSGRFYLKRYENGQYLIHWYSSRRKR